ncbi:Cloroperoxidase [Coprinopsis marcescibilis]|uniref:Cloroperoxidase n=1 Tax=Coprinopsis marcescibilis TaxID=230819 RepID=A0A5C3KH10_COPMA|nr:Cloroperoxidase [Coprinopsis marcescibilis]
MHPNRLLSATILAVVAGTALAFPSYESLAGLTGRQLESAIQGLNPKLPPPPPGPLSFSGTKLVDDPAHPWRPLRNGDLRGPCPGLNTLASHGYLPRDGVASPAQFITAVQEGFNMDNPTARVATYLTHLVDGNLVTDLLSIGAKTRRTGPDPPPPAIVGGMNNHGTFEGDASLSRGDAFDGDNHNFNQTLWDQLVDYSNQYGGGFYNLTVAGELRWQRTQQSIATNPEFDFRGLRHFTVVGQASFPAGLFTDGRKTGADKHQLDLVSGLSFFKHMRFPAGFFRASEPTGGVGSDVIFGAHPVLPGRNVGGVNNYVVDTSLGGFGDFCKFYTEFVNITIKGLYPNPTGVLRRNLNLNLGFVYDALAPRLGANCPQVFPYGTN